MTTRRTWLGLVALVLTVSACGGGATGPKIVSGGTVNVRMLFDPGNLDPQLAVSAAQEGFATYLYDALVADVSGHIEPVIATKWTVTPDSASFTLRTDVTCDGGHQITASDVAANYDRIKNPALKAPYVSALLGSTGYTVSADDAAHTFKISLPKPFGDLIYGVAGIPIVCPSGLADPAALSKRSFGTGPFVLQDAVPGDHYTLTRRNGYSWGPNGATNATGPNTLVVKVVTNETTAANELLSGGLDIANVSGADRKRLDADKSLYRQVAFGQVWSILFDHRSGHATSDVNVRKALAQAIGRADLNTAMFGGFGHLEQNYLTPDAPCQSNTTGSMPSFDLSAARSALQAAGYTAGADGRMTRAGQPLTIHMLIPDVVSGAADYLLSQWGKLGVNVVSDVRPATQVVQTILGGGDWDTTIISIGANLPSHYLAFLTGPTPPKGTNFSFIDNSEYTSLAAQAAQQVTTQSCGVWQQAEKAAYAQVDILPIAVDTTGWYGKNVQLSPASLTAVWPTSIRRTA